MIGSIISVYNRTGLDHLEEGLVRSNVRLIASGVTAKQLRGREFEVARMKTLLSAIHGGILARDLESDKKDLAQIETLSKPGVQLDEMQEQIGIRVVALPRAAAKNYDRVSVLCDPSDYHAFLQELDQEEIPELSRQKYALEAFEHFAGYYSAIADFSRENYRQYRLIPLSLLDALEAWQLVKEFKMALGLPAAASFKHVSPASAAVGVPQAECQYELSRPERKFDGIVAPGYQQEAFEILSEKKSGKYLVLQMDSSHDPPRTEERTVYVVTLPQGRNDCVVTTETFNKILTPRDVANPFPEAASDAIDLLCSGLDPKHGFEREEFSRMFEEVSQLFTTDERKASLNIL
ncbi:MAG: hypothetical protein GOMPHAMPRED_002548 [Gomphillus americanus]|uniref:Uncharacterized protein n=1 Tax=Gomphillus americanus TaxID=1940652 RepID=A0A8H3FGP8_9LECA|nr:MAG: hypothetical protein GOMPHAMPRED_002548 [Gomphillus americanus]